MKKYDEEFKREAVKKYLDGQSVASISRELGVNENTIHKWKKDYLAETVEDSEAIRELRKRNLELEMENEILKKATAYFARNV
ncbi:MAG: transposase [Pyrinomonadaceae bacterium]